jgi:hypothetical protein
MWGAIAKRSVGIAFWDVGMRSLFGMWECDSEALRRNRFWDVGSAIAKRSVGIAVWDFGSAIAFWGCGKCDSEALRRNRFWVWGDGGVR